jgi:Ser/Thr protein kinase RdoA (MazF antagonist)
MTDEHFARRALEAYDLAPTARPRLISVSENSTFLVEEDTPVGVLRIYRPDYQSDAAIRSELAWIDAVRDAGLLSTPAIRRTRTGEPLEWIEVDGATRACVLFDYVAGCEPSHDDLDTYELVGRTAATLHLQVQQWKRPVWFTRTMWDLDNILGPRAPWGQWCDGPGLRQDDITLLKYAEDKVRTNLADYPARGPIAGLVHCDLRAANLLKDPNGRVWVIDFDDSGFSWYLWDLCSSTTFIEHLPHVGSVIDAWLQGYQKVRPLTARDIAAIPDLVFLRRLHLLAWLGSHPNSDLAHELGDSFTMATCELADRYLARTFLPDLQP